MNASSPITETHVNTAAGRLFVTQTGQGRAVVLWPSIFTDHRVYDALMPLLAGYRVIRIDGPGHGRSGAPVPALTMESCGQAMIDVMDALGVETAVLGGTSWGGIAAAHGARLAPNRAEALVLMNTPMELGQERPSLGTRFIAWGARWIAGASMFRNGVAKSFFTDPAFTTNPAYGVAFHAMLRGADRVALGAAVGAVLMRSSPLAALLPDIEVPTLVIAGRDDPMYAVSQQEDAAARLKDGRVAVVAGKHISVVDAPEAVADAISGFLARR